MRFRDIKVGMKLVVSKQPKETHKLCPPFGIKIGSIVIVEMVDKYDSTFRSTGEDWFEPSWVSVYTGECEVPQGPIEVLSLEEQLKNAEMAVIQLKEKIADSKLIKDIKVGDRFKEWGSSPRKFVLIMDTFGKFLFGGCGGDDFNLYSDTPRTRDAIIEHINKNKWTKIN